jgi:hypothetical protein
MYRTRFVFRAFMQESGDCTPIGKLLSLLSRYHVSVPRFSLRVQGTKTQVTGMHLSQTSQKNAQPFSGKYLDL